MKNIAADKSVVVLAGKKEYKLQEAQVVRRIVVYLSQPLKRKHMKS